MTVADLYPWLKAFHIISIIAWMAAMLYLPRLFVYHADAEPGSDKSETFKVMERRLLRAIMTPAMGASLLFGGGLLLLPGIIDWHAGWIWIKIAMVAGFLVMHERLACWQRDFARDRNRKTARFYRMINEIPTVLIIGTVVLAVVKPF